MSEIHSLEKGGPGDAKRARDMIGFWEYRSSLFARYDLPNMEKLWMVMVHAAMGKWQNLTLTLDHLAKRMDQPTDVAVRLVRLLSTAELIAERDSAENGHVLEITDLGENFVVEALREVQSPIGNVEPPAIPLPR